MKVPLIIFYFLVFNALIGVGQNFANSNLPIVIITTDINPLTDQPYTIMDGEKVLASMKIIFRPDGSRNYISDQNNADFLNYNGKISIEIRGQSSASLPKKPYGFETVKSDHVTNNNVPLLGLPEENDWVLNAAAFDKSLIRDYLSYHLSNAIGQYASKGRYCEVMVNGNYRGIYILMEKIKRDNNRVNIAELTPEDTQLPKLSGGYITKADKLSTGENINWTYFNHSGHHVNFLHHEPKQDEISQSQHHYIKSIFDKLEETAASNNISSANGFPSVIDMASFVDYMVISELASNADSYQFSTFFHKERNGKLRAGPVWDFNLTYGNDLFQWGLDRSHTGVWQFDNWDNVGANFWRNLYRNPLFSCYFSKRWSELSSGDGALDFDHIESIMDSLVNLLTEARTREDQRWNTLEGFDLHIQNMKSWIQDRIDWLDKNTKSLSTCQFPEPPKIVITRIHYHPKKAGVFSSDDLEFIELTNVEETEVDISGYYISEPGIGYVFPNFPKLKPGQKIYLANNTSAFESFYGFLPFGEYERNLSNKSYPIVIRDPFGNIVDEVVYSDESPWPKVADGDGPYLQLKSPELDNSLAENWMPSEDGLASTHYEPQSGFKVFPNPFHNNVTIYSQGDEISKIDCYSAIGIKINTFYNDTSIYFEEVPEGLYFIHIFYASGKMRIAKLVKSN